MASKVSLVTGSLLFASFLPGLHAQDACPKGPTFPDTASNCNAWHTVVSGDSCYSLEQQFGITSQLFLSWNPSVSSDCLTNFWLGQAYCVSVGTLQTACSSGTTSTTTTTSSSSSSSSISTTTTTENATYSTHLPITTFNLTTISTGTAWPPTRTKAGQPTYCRSWHLVGPGDTCQSIVNQHGAAVTMDELLEWNPSLGSDCSGLYVGWWVCVGIQSQTSLTLTWSMSATNASVPAPTSYTPPTSTSINFAFTPSPTQAGMPGSCKSYYLAQASDTCRSILSMITYITKDQFFAWNPALNGNCDGIWAGYYYCVANIDSSSPPMPTVTAKPSTVAGGTPDSCTAWYNTTVGDTCDRVALQFGSFSKADFISWNPIVGPDCSNLQMGLYYCVAVKGTPTTRTAPYSTTATSSLPLTTNCADTWFVGVGDSCQSIVDANDISMTNFLLWNPQLSATKPSQCSVVANSYVCVGIAGNNTSTSVPGPTTSSTLSGSTTTSSTSTSSTASSTSTGGAVSTPLPTQAGMVAGCVRFYYVEQGDGCWAIANAAGIDLSTFVSWNPGVGSDCSAMWLHSYCCIGIHGPVTTITSGPPVPAPTS